MPFKFRFGVRLFALLLVVFVFSFIPFLVSVKPLKESELHTERLEKRSLQSAVVVSELPEDLKPSTVEDGIRPVIWETSEDKEALVDTRQHLVLAYHAGDLDQRKRLDIAFELLVTFVTFLDANNISYWLTHGALLGSFREGNMMSWDHDVDVAVPYESVQRILALVTRPGFRWHRPNTVIIFRSGRHAHIIPFKVVDTSTGVFLDAFMFLRTQMVVATLQDLSNPESGTWSYKLEEPARAGVKLLWPYPCHTCHGAQLGFQFADEDLYPLRLDCKLRDRSFACPRKTEAYLMAWYDTLEIRKY